MVSFLPCFVYTCQAKALRKGKLASIKAPGQLIKPKTDKTRGRPRLPTHVQITLIENNEEDNSIITFDCVD